MESVNTVEKDSSRTEAGPDVRPDFRHVKSWLFDLDNTLYCADSGIFAQIEARMVELEHNGAREAAVTDDVA